MTKQVEPETLGHYLRSLRVKRHGKSLEEMSQISGISKTSLSDIENNQQIPTLKSAKVIANAYITTLEKMGKFV